MARRSNFGPNVKQSRWTKPEVLIGLLVVPGCFVWLIVTEMKSDDFLKKTHQIEIGMSLPEAIAILGEPMKRQPSKEDYLRHDERPRWAELGKENLLIEVTWDGSGYIFRAFVVKDEIIATRNKRKGHKP